MRAGDTYIRKRCVYRVRLSSVNGRLWTQAFQCDMTHTYLRDVYLSDPIIGRNENIHKCCVNGALTMR